MNEAKINKVKEIIANAGNHFFKVKFIKKDGSEREMICRKGVTKYLKSDGKSTIAHKPNLISVYDTIAKGYRCINAETVISVKAEGKEFTFE